MSEQQLPDDGSHGTSDQGGCAASLEARTCVLCGGPCLQTPEDTDEQYSGPAEIHWLQESCVLLHNKETRWPWQHTHPRIDRQPAGVGSGTAATQDAAAGGGLAAGAAAAAAEAGGASAGNEGQAVGDLAAGAAAAVEGAQDVAGNLEQPGGTSDGGSEEADSDYWNEEGWDSDDPVDWNVNRKNTYDIKMTITKRGFLWNHRVQVGMDSWAWWQVADWPPQGTVDEARDNDHSSYDWGAGLLMHKTCAEVLEACLARAAGAVRMEDIYNYLIRHGCPNAPDLDYGGNIASCWDSACRTFTAAAGSKWLLAQPPKHLPNPLPCLENAGASTSGQLDSAGSKSSTAPAAVNNSSQLDAAGTRRRSSQGQAAAVAPDPQLQSKLLQLDGASFACVLQHGGLSMLLELACCCRQLHERTAQLLLAPGSAVWRQECQLLMPYLDLVQQERKVFRHRNSSTFTGGIDWRRVYAGVCGANAMAADAGVRNGMRISGVIEGMCRELQVQASST